MRIITLVENTSKGNFAPKHGLSLYIETEKHKLLFDVGPDETVFENAKKCGIDLREVDTVIISHGHNDHGGALEKFLKLNESAKVYIQRAAFENHYSKTEAKSNNIGLHLETEKYPQVILLNGDYTIDEELHLFTVPNGNEYYSSANDNLYTDEGHDDFRHEQNLLLSDGENRLLVLGCGHRGVVNILKRAALYQPKLCIGGFHLYSPRTGESVPDNVLEGIAGELKAYDMKFYTCHCTGEKAFSFLEQRVPSMHYLACGDEIDI